MQVNKPTQPVLTQFTIPPATGSVGQKVWQITSSPQFQNVLYQCAPGDILEIPAGSRLVAPVGGFILPAKSNPQGLWITIRSSLAITLSLDKRVSPGNQLQMASLIGQDSGPVLLTAQSQSNNVAFYYFAGLNITVLSTSMPDAKDPHTQFNSGLIRLGDLSETSLSHMPHDFIFDRCIIAGQPNLNTIRGIALNCSRVAIVNCYLPDFHAIGNDAQAIWGSNGLGMYLIQNNYLEGSGENIMFGGTDPKIQGLIPSDIIIRGNTIAKPLTWKQNDPSYLGYHWGIKNLLELKNAQRVLIENNEFSGSWADAQTGIGISFKSNNQDGTAPWCQTSDVEFRNNKITGVGLGVSILGTDFNQKTDNLTSRIWIHDNDFADINSRWTGNTQAASGNAMQVLSAVDLLVENNSFDNNGNALVLDSADPNSTVKTERFAFRNNVVNFGPYGIKGSGAASGNDSIAKFIDDADFTGNNFIGDVSLIKQYPVNNSILASRPVRKPSLPTADLTIKGTVQFDPLTGKLSFTSAPIITLE